MDHPAAVRVLMTRRCPDFPQKADGASWIAQFCGAPSNLNPSDESAGLVIRSDPLQFLPVLAGNVLD